MENQFLSRFKMNKKFAPLNSFLYYCKSCIISMVEYADEHTLVSEQINYRSDKDRLELEKAVTNKQISAEQWLTENGYTDVAYSLYYKNLFFSLLVDFSNYINASIDMASAGNINVAWALTRKPLQETLAYFEWLYVNKTELIELMLQGDVEKYRTSSKGVREKIKEHIDKIQSQVVAKKINMYNFRYSRDEAFTLNGIMQATNHLVTTRSVLKTSPSGLNFVFMDDEIYDRNIGFYYTSIPYVIQYSLGIIMNLFAEIAKHGSYTVLMNRWNLMLKMLQAIGTPYETAKELLELNEVDLYCPQCGGKHHSDEAWINFTNNQFRCKYCGQKLDTQRYIWDFENLHFCIDDENPKA